jgi:hypothetical protein
LCSKGRSSNPGLYQWGTTKVVPLFFCPNFAGPGFLSLIDDAIVSRRIAHIASGSFNA